ncbi:hypothetical protein GCM10023194_24690 [Planotetraspora phitsanulokensis]|uniref:Uncharacterized protein n=1 Tax=Planotetraspora phitsanulokensis TaxID=575192 RepID=A0A8J3UC20_9ACTN|nr:hypothetical protein Pph01_77020 [Planotetraspora phitsanulokensis]
MRVPETELLQREINDFPPSDEIWTFRVTAFSCDATPKLPLRENVGAEVPIGGWQT